MTALLLYIEHAIETQIKRDVFSLTSDLTYAASVQQKLKAP